ncbi:MAG: hypothetical protein H6706_17540 [Myxococcales bacterium]|nr:hypothetical protein [Myxococcales bacterium]
MTPLLAALSLGVALRLDLPEDAPTLGGLEADVRWAPVPGTVLGAAVGWGGGVNDTNPDRKLISQRFEGVALAGASLALGDGLALTLLGRAGIARLEGWPNGALTRISRFSPTVGAEAGARIDVTPTVALEPRVGLSWVRVAADDRFIPGAALAVHFTLGDP